MSRRRKALDFKKTKIIPSSSTENNWSDRELVDLVSAVQRYGSSETKKIADAVGTKSETAVQMFLTLESNKVRQKLAKENDWTVRKGCAWHDPDTEELSRWPPVRKWRRMVYNQMQQASRKNNYSKIALEELFQAFYDEAKETNNPEMINVKVIYKFLLDCIRGQVPGELSPLDSGIVLILLGQLVEMNTELDFDEEVSFIKNFVKAKTFVPLKVKDEFEARAIKRSKELQNIVNFSESNKGAEKGFCSNQVDSKAVDDEEKNIVKLPEEMYENLCKHRKLVQSFNPMNIPLCTLVKEQAYIQNKCELAQQTSFTTTPNTGSQDI